MSSFEASLSKSILAQKDTLPCLSGAFVSQALQEMGVVTKVYCTSYTPACNTYVYPLSPIYIYIYTYSPSVSQPHKLVKFEC